MRTLITKAVLGVALVTGGSFAAAEITQQVSLPEQANEDASQHTPTDHTLPQEATRGQEAAAAKAAAAQAYAEAVRTWTSCVSDAAQAHEASESEEGFDPVEACGDRPAPSAEMTTPPSWSGTDGETEGGQPDDLPTPENVPTSEDEQPSGPPSDVPSGRP